MHTCGKVFVCSRDESHKIKNKRDMKETFVVCLSPCIQILKKDVNVNPFQANQMCVQNAGHPHCSKTPLKQCTSSPHLWYKQSTLMLTCAVGKIDQVWPCKAVLASLRPRTYSSKKLKKRGELLTARLTTVCAHFYAACLARVKPCAHP